MNADFYEEYGFIYFIAMDTRVTILMNGEILGANDFYSCIRGSKKY